ncbi:MAG: flagellar filament outer layer protein FlaA [Brevinema sp.]
MKQGRSIISLMLFLGVLAPVTAVERSLIDFTTYNDNIAQVMNTDQELYEQAIADNPDLDIRNFGWPEFNFETEDWNLENWKVVLNPSATTKENLSESVTKNSPSQQYGNVLGVRLQFQPWQNPFWAAIKKPFYFAHTYVNGTFISQDENDQDNGLAVGILANVGQIKNVRSWVYGLNYNYNYGVKVVNEMGKEIEFGMGSIYHEGWRRVAWNNTQYSTNPNSWTPIKNPLYPYSFPYIKFDSLAFYKPAGNVDPNFIGYVRDVTMDFDIAIVREDQDINDEAIWQMLAKDSMKKKIVMSKILAEEILARRKIQQIQNANQAVANEAAGQ